MEATKRSNVRIYCGASKAYFKEVEGSFFNTIDV